MAVHIKYHPRLYLSDGITQKELDKIKNKLQKKPIISNVFLLTPAENQIDMLDIFESKLLAQPHYQNKEIFVIGITKTYSEALNMIEYIVRECLDSRGDCSLREYLSC